MRNKRRKSRLTKWIVILAVIIVLGGGLFFTYEYLLREYKVDTVVVEGNVHYTDDEIADLVMQGKYGDNSLYLSYKYKNKEINDIPFVEAINVKIVDKRTIRISVYEKVFAGYIEYLGRNIYFDKDGVVIESSQVKTAGVAKVVGVDFDYVVLHEKLPAKDENLFKKVLDVTLLTTKYKVNVDEMYFAPSGEIMLYCKDVCVKLGKEENLDIKIMNLPSILENLEGRKGTLRMEDYSEGTKRVSFEVDENE